ncbi:MAG: ATP-binding cassette domain-containing protein [Bacteroidia bacterium]|nr:ATP-binding cassette domain-containing protein [Bacteroidia bacterium]
MNLHIHLQGIGKKFYHRWIFRDISHDFSQHPHLALIGRNGSGKSTLLRIIAGQLAPSAGKAIYTKGKMRVSVENVYQYLSWAGPFTDIYPDLTLEEHIRLHFGFRKCLLSSPEDMVSVLHLEEHKDKKLRYYSSGMLQRVKVGLALFSQSDILILDEPTSNMDAETARWILDLIAENIGSRIYVLASNMEREYEGINQRLHL